jgi:hypothetical protein
MKRTRKWLMSERGIDSEKGKSRRGYEVKVAVKAEVALKGEKHGKEKEVANE